MTLILLLFLINYDIKSDKMKILNYAERIFELIGNVEIKDTNFTAKSPYGKFFEKKEIVLLKNGAKVEGKTWNIECEEISYNLKNKKAEFQNNVKIEDTLYFIKTNFIVYEKNNAFSPQKLEVLRKTDSTIIKGDSGIYSFTKKQGWTFGNSKIIKKNLKIEANKILFAQNFIIAVGNVKISKDTNKMFGDSLFYKNDTLKLFGNYSKIFWENNKGISKEINVILKKDTIKEIHLKNECQVFWKSEEGNLILNADFVKFRQKEVYASGNVKAKWVEKPKSEKFDKNIRKKKGSQ